jgi:hypothetical protein
MAEPGSSVNEVQVRLFRLNANNYILARFSMNNSLGIVNIHVPSMDSDEY